jgi:threonine/homoserine/homoserine lactone efflux protein
VKLIFLSAFVAGLAYCAAPGVINAEALRRALTRGFRAALLFQLGALAGDAIWAAIALSGVFIISPGALLHRVLGIGGALFLGWMAWGAMRDSLRGRMPALLHTSRNDDLFLGLVLSLANPFAIVFWLSVGGGLLRASASAPQLTGAAAAVGAFVLATLIWSVLLAGLASYGRSLITAAGFRWLNAGAGVCMALFGVDLIWQTLAVI